MLDNQEYSWVNYFIDIAETVSKRSKCYGRKVGAVIARDKTILSVGYNGPPRGVRHCNELTDEEVLFIGGHKNAIRNTLEPCIKRRIGFASGTGMEYCQAGHAERNAIVNAAREGIRLNGASIYMTCGMPCKDCMIEIINAGITSMYLNKIALYDNLSFHLYKESVIRGFAKKEEGGFIYIPHDKRYSKEFFLRHNLKGRY